MPTTAQVLMGMVLLGFTALAMCALYRWQRRGRVRRIEGLVRNYLTARYNGLPGHLQIQCSDDPLWPVLVAFDGPCAGTRRRIRFDCSGPRSALSILSETEEQGEDRR